MKSKWVKAIAFLLIGAVLFSVFWQVFHFKYSKAMEKFKKLPKNTVDVLFIGSSHVFRNIDPSVLYRESGISGFDLGSPAQLIWNSYYSLREALKTQSPKVVFIECYKINAKKDYSSDAITVKATGGMDYFSSNRIEAIVETVQDKSPVLDLILSFPLFHSRYKEIGPIDYKPDYANPYYKDFLGYTWLKQRVKTDLPKKVSKIKKKKPLTQKTMLYLDKIVKLSEEKGFSLVFLITPFGKETAVKLQPYYNTLAAYAKEKNVEFINCNLLYDEIHLDEKRDISRANHLSITGAEKATLYLNNYLKTHWTLEDHRGDPKYGTWERNVVFMENLRKTKDIAVTDIDDDEL